MMTNEQWQAKWKAEHEEERAAFEKYGCKASLRKCPVCGGKLEYAGQPGDYGFDQKCGSCGIKGDVDAWKWIKVRKLRDGWSYTVVKGELLADKHDGNGPVMESCYVGLDHEKCCGKCRSVALKSEKELARNVCDACWNELFPVSP